MILTTGSMPFVPPLPGVELDNVFPIFKDVAYLRGLQDKLKQAKDVVVIGGGFIGVAFADECAKIGGLNITVIELLPHCLLLACDASICVEAEKKLAEAGVKVLANHRAEALLGNKKVAHVLLEGGTKIKADVVILGIGVAPNVTLAEQAGLRVNPRLGIEVDAFMGTSDAHIFAAGDCAQKRCYFTGRPSQLRLASTAAVEARIAAANLRGLRRRNGGAIGIFSTRIGSLALGAAGLTERAAQAAQAAQAAGFDIVTGEASAPDRHPGCMPDASELMVKLVFEKHTNAIIGGQAYGGASTGEVTNFIGALIQQKARAEDIATFQVGTHPALTASPIAYQVVNAAENAQVKQAK